MKRESSSILKSKQQQAIEILLMCVLTNQDVLVHASALFFAAFFFLFSFFSFFFRLSSLVSLSRSLSFRGDRTIVLCTICDFNCCCVRSVLTLNDSDEA